MDHNVIHDIQKHLTELDDKYESILSKIRSHEIDEQLYLKKNTMIPPGSGAKIVYDSNGLILRSENLLPQDIPELSIDHISGLRRLLDSKVSNLDIKSLSVENTTSTNPIISGTGIKVNYNSDGKIVSISDLISDDIPMIPMSKVEGLEEVIDYLKSFHSDDKNIVDVQHPTVIPGTYTKITINKDGHVLNGSKLTSADLPAEIVTRLNTLETNMLSYASGTALQALVNLVNLKLDRSTTITPGTYTKISVNKDGLVTGGSNTTLNDLPEIQISDVVNLQSELLSKAKMSDIVILNESIGRMSSTLSQVGEIISMKQEIKGKAEQTDLSSLETKVDRLYNELETILSRSEDNGSLLDEILQMKSSISMIIGRLNTLERLVNSFSVEKI